MRQGRRESQCSRPKQRREGTGRSLNCSLRRSHSLKRTLAHDAERLEHVFLHLPRLPPLIYHLLQNTQKSWVSHSQRSSSHLSASAKCVSSSINLDFGAHIDPFHFSVCRHSHGLYYLIRLSDLSDLKPYLCRSVWTPLVKPPFSTS